MSLLTMMQQVCPRIGIARPAAVASSSDQQLIDLLAIANEEGQDLAKRYAFQNITYEATFTTVATESQGAITTIAGTDFDRILNETIWNRTLRRPVFGPLTGQQWQQLKAQVLNGPWNQYRIRGNQVLFTPVPAAGQSCYFEWVSKNWTVNAAGSVKSSIWNADDDTGLIDESVMALGIVWRWKAANSLEYAEDFAKYERQVAEITARDGGKQTLNLAGTSYDLLPAIVVPSGSWSL